MEWVSARGWAWMRKRRPCTEDPLRLYIIDPVLYVLYMSVQLTLIATPRGKQCYPILKKIQLGPEGPSNLPKDTQCIERQKPGFKCRPVDSNSLSAQGCFYGRPRPDPVRVGIFVSVITGCSTALTLAKGKHAWLSPQRAGGSPNLPR